jgi:serine protease Do
MHRGRGLRGTRFAFTCAIAGWAIAAGRASPHRVAASEPAAQEVETAPAADPVADLNRLSEAFSLIAEKVKPSVVNIRAISFTQANLTGDGRRPRGNIAGLIPTTGTGSGIILDDDGHIVTNCHVVARSRAVWVTLADGRKYRGTVVGTDPKTDIAVLHIRADRLQPARFGDSDAVRVGHIVLAIGSPFRLGHSVSHGIISGLGRSEDIDVDIDYKNWLQTDAPVNPGNSGGPLINSRGEVIGINVAIATESGGHQGVAFAIPANTVTRIAGLLKTGQRIVRGYLGVQFKAVGDAEASAYGLPGPGGVLIDVIRDDSPAAGSGLRQEDIVLAINDRPVRTGEQLQEYIASTRPDSEVELTVWRARTRHKLTVTVGAQPEGFTTTLRSGFRRGLPDEEQDEEDAARPEELTVTGRFGGFGFDARTLTAPLIRQYDLELDPARREGVVVTRIDPASEAYDAGLQTGSVIIRADDQPVRNVDDLARILTEEAVARGVRLRVMNDRNEQNLILRIR